MQLSTLPRTSRLSSARLAEKSEDVLAIIIVLSYLLWNKHARSLQENATPPSCNHTFVVFIIEYTCSDPARRCYTSLLGTARVGMGNSGAGAALAALKFPPKRGVGKKTARLSSPLRQQLRAAER